MADFNRDDQMQLFESGESVAQNKQAEMLSIQELFEYWKELFGFPNRRLTAGRLRHLRLVLKHYTKEQLRLVLETAAVDPGCRGQNANNTPYDDIVNIFRNEERVDRYLQMAERTNRKTPDLTPQAGHRSEYF